MMTSHHLLTTFLHYFLIANLLLGLQPGFNEPQKGVEAMIQYLVVILVAILFSAPAFAGGKEDCDAKCQAYKHAASDGPVPYRNQTICIAYKQAHADNIVVRFYDAAGKELDANDPLHNRKAAPTQGTICPAAHWFRDAAYAELCNSTEGRKLRKSTLLVLLKLGATPAGRFVHLDVPRH